MIQIVLNCQKVDAGVEKHFTKSFCLFHILMNPFASNSMHTGWVWCSALGDHCSMLLSHTTRQKLCFQGIRKINSVSVHVQKCPNLNFTAFRKITFYFNFSSIAILALKGQYKFKIMRGFRNLHTQDDIISHQSYQATVLFT